MAKTTVMLCQKGTYGQFPPGMLYEPKLDGIRAVATKAGLSVRLLGRSGEEYTKKFPEITHELRNLTPQDFVVDGEVCGKDFNSLAGRVHLEDPFKIGMRSKVEPCTYHIFDLLALDGRRLTELPLVERKKALETLGETEHVRIVRSEPLDALLERVEKQEIEGVVAKQPSSPYEFSRSPNWIKFRPSESQDLPIIGYEESDKPDRPYRSLILQRGDGEVQASSGLSQEDLERTHEMFSRSEIVRTVGRKRYFKHPVGIAEISFYGDGSIPFRFPKVKRLRFDLPDKELEVTDAQEK